MNYTITDADVKNIKDAANTAETATHVFFAQSSYAEGS